MEKLMEAAGSIRVSVMHKHKYAFVWFSKGFFCVFKYIISNKFYIILSGKSM